MERYTFWRYGVDQWAVVFDKTKTIAEGFDSQLEAKAWLDGHFDDLERKRLNPPKRKRR